MQRYQVTCLKCKKSDNILIDKRSIIAFEKGASTNFLAGRYRKDMQWGWECICGNDNRLSKQEENMFDTLIDPRSNKLGIDKIMAGLKLDDSKQFKMEAV